ncbi:hypothetical protein ACQ4PT_029117 [Festuca glaucescens]
MTGITPSLNLAAGLLGYFFVRTWTAALERFGIDSKPFTKQENTVIQTCVVACYGLACSGIGNIDGNKHEIGLRLSPCPAFQVFICLFVILGDGLYNLIKIICAYIKEITNARSKQGRLPIARVEDGSCYLGLAAISSATVPMVFPQLKWHLVLSACVVAPLLAFCNSYGTGLTGWNLASTYGKIGLFVFASSVGHNGGVIAGLAACGVMMSIVFTAADLMQDFKTGYLTLSSPRSMFVSQLIGTALGCFIAPLTFWVYWTAFDTGDPDGVFKAPNAIILREMSILGVEGFSSLPQHCLGICSFFFIAAIVIDLLRDVTPRGVSKFIPLPMAMAIPFYFGAYFAVDMIVGTVILFVWERVNRKDSQDFAAAIASGLICGDGIWSVPSAILSILRIDPPVCMYFKPSLTG